MVKLQKYLFDTDFGTPRIAAVEMAFADDGGELMELEPPPPPPLSFSEEELSLARDQAFEAGRQSGLQEAATTLEQMQGMAMATMAHHLQGMAGAQAAANQAQSREAVAIGLAIVRKLHPEFCRRFGLAEIEAALTEAIAGLEQVARITVKVHPDLLEAVKEKIGALTVQSGFDGKLVVAADPAMALGDCRLDWGDGGTERDMGRTWADIDRAVEAALGALQIPGQTPE